MDSTHNSESTVKEAGGAFAETCWTVVLAAGQEDSAPSRDALAKLCGAYWPPLYAYVRRRGFDAHEAQDLTQDFFARLIEKGWLRDVDARKGRFRSWLLASLGHFLANEWARRKTQKRGGGVVILPLHFEDSETRYQLDPPDDRTPDQLYEQQWVHTLLARALAALREEYQSAGKSTLFEVLQPHLSGDREAGPGTDAASRLGLTEGATRAALLRMRRRMGELVRAEVAHTVSTPAEVDEEIAQLFATLGR
jgi:RNA polymerase sigma-70 factor (ECF subfamily)